jgi:hypothetical protein
MRHAPRASQPKLASHMNQCYGGAFTCIDCSVTFDRGSVQARVWHMRKRVGMRSRREGCTHARRRLTRRMRAR